MARLCATGAARSAGTVTLPVLLATLFGTLAAAAARAAVIPPGKTTWHPPSAPSAFIIKAKSLWNWEAAASDNNIPIQIARYHNHLAISYTDQENMVYMPVVPSQNTTAYNLQWSGSPLGLPVETYNCSSIPGGVTFWGSQVYGIYWAILNVIETTAPWQFGGEVITILPSGKPTVTSVIWRKISSSSSTFTAVFDAATLRPTTLAVHTTAPPNFLNVFDEPVAVADETYSFTVTSYSTNNKKSAIKRVASPPASLNLLKECPSIFVDGAGAALRAPATFAPKSAGASAWTPDWKAADAFFAAKATGLTNLSGVSNLTLIFKDLFPHLRPYAPGPVAANASAPYSLASLGVTFTIKNQALCGACYAVASMTALETAVVVQSSSASGSRQVGAPLLSAQYLVDCTPTILPLESQNIFAGNTGGCGGGLSQQVYEFIIQEGGIVPLDESYKFAGVNGKCRRDMPGFQTHLSHYLSVLSEVEMRNALVNYGAVAVSVSAFPWGTTVTLPGQASPCPAPVQGPNDPNINHEVVVIGWQSCQLPNGTMTECWIVQNSWGVTAGYRGFFYVPTDLSLDCGILSSTLAIVPVLNWP